MQISRKHRPGFSRTRRSILQAAPMLAFAPRLLAQSAPGIRVRKLNSFEIRVSDVDRSRAFYQDLFGTPVQGRFGERVSLRIGEGPQFMAIRRALPGETPAITQLGYAVEDYDIDGLLAALERLGYERIPAPPVEEPGIDNAMKSWIRMRGDTVELYFADARGLIVQLASPEYCGGGGELGDQCVLEAAPEGLIRLTDINHFTAFVSDGAAANAYYQEIFGLSVQAYQGPNSPVTGIGDGYQFVMYGGGGGGSTPANIHHASFAMEDFDVDRVRAMLTDYGLQARAESEGPGPAPAAGPLMHYVSLRMPARGGAEGGTPELYFTDPDGILMQLQHTSYCGGGGKLGEICLNTEA